MWLDDFKNFMNSDWKQIVVDKFNRISPVSKKSFLWIFLIVNLVFLWHTITFFWGNHDWRHIKEGVRVAWSLFDGRYGAGLIQQLTGGDILPVWNNLFCFAGFSLAVVFLAKYWELPKNSFIYTIFGLFIILMPYTQPWLQFVRSETHFWNIFLIVIALMLCSTKKIWAYFGAFLIFYFCLGCYAAMISTIFTILLGRCVLDVWFENKTLKQGFKDYWKTILVIVLSFIAFVITWKCITRPEEGLYATSTIHTVSLGMLVNNFVDIGKGLKETFFYELPYMSVYFKILLGLAIPITFCMMFKLSKKRIAILCFLYAGLLISSQLTNLLSVSNYVNQLRIDFFSMPYIYALFYAILLRTGKCWENIAILFMCIAIFYSGLQDVRDQKVKYFDKLRDVKIFENIANNIKSNPKFDSNKKYNLVVIGELQSLSKLSSFDIYNSKIKWQDSWIPFVPGWSMKDFLDFYERQSYADATVYTTTRITDEIIRDMDNYYLLNIAKPYPSLNSVHLDDNYIYIILSQESLEEFKEHVRQVIHAK